MSVSIHWCPTPPLWCQSVNLNLFPSTRVLPDVPVCERAESPLCSTAAHQHVAHGTGQFTLSYPSSTSCVVNTEGSTFTRRSPPLMHLSSNGEHWITNDRGKRGDAVRSRLEPVMPVGLGRPGPSTGKGVDTSRVEKRVVELGVQGMDRWDAARLVGQELRPEDPYRAETVLDHFYRHGPHGSHGSGK